MRYIRNIKVNSEYSFPILCLVFVPCVITGRRPLREIFLCIVWNTSGMNKVNIVMEMLHGLLDGRLQSCKFTEPTGSTP